MGVGGGEAERKWQRDRPSVSQIGRGTEQMRERVANRQRRREEQIVPEKEREKEMERYLDSERKRGRERISDIERMRERERMRDLKGTEGVGPQRKMSLKNKEEQEPYNGTKQRTTREWD